MSTPRAATSRGNRSRILQVVLIVAVVLAVALLGMRSAYREGPLEPNSPQPEGSRAVVRVLKDLGVDTDRVSTVQTAADRLRSGDTVLVTASEDLNTEQLSVLRDAYREGAGHLVLVRPSGQVLSRLDTPFISVRRANTDPILDGVARQCPGGGAFAQHVRIEGLTDPAGNPLSTADRYAVRKDAADPTAISLCPSPEQQQVDGPTGIVASSGRLTVLGTPAILANDGITSADNAAIALAALAPSADLAWYVPSSADPLATQTSSPLDLIPPWVLPSLAWLIVLVLAGLAAAWWRLGPVLVEPLPVSVPAQELTVGRAGLMESSRTHDAAAASLRAGALRRLSSRLGIRRERTVDAVVAAAQEHTHLSPERLRGLLSTDPITTDEELVRLAADLDALEKEIDR